MLLLIALPRKGSKEVMSNISEHEFANVRSTR